MGRTQRLPHQIFQVWHQCPKSIGREKEIPPPRILNSWRCPSVHCQRWWGETDKEGDNWMREKENYVRRVPHHRAFWTHECEICTGVSWDGGHRKDLPTRECFMSSIPHGFSGHVIQIGETACGVTTPLWGTINSSLVRRVG